MDLKRILTGCVLAFISTIHAVDYSYAIFTDGRYSNNISQSFTPVSGYSNTTGFSFQFQENSYQDWEASMAGGINYEYFSESDLGTQKQMQFSGDFFYRPRSNNFSLRIIDSLSQEPANRFSTEVIDNVREINTFSVLPAYFFRLSSVEQLTFEAALTKIKNDGILEGSATIDGSRKIGRFTVDYRRQLNSSQSFFLVASQLETDFSASIDEGAVDYEQSDLSLRWLISGRATRVQVEAGISQIADVLGNKYDTDLIALRLTREINRAQRFVLNATQGFDREIEYNFTNDSIVQGNGNYSIISPQVRKELDLTFTHTTSDGFNGNVRAFVFESEGVVQNSSEQQKGLVTTLSYPIHGLYSGNHRAILELLASKTYNEFNNSFSSVTENQVDLTELTFYQSLSSDLSYFVEFRFRQSDGSDSSSNYLGADSKSIAIGFRYAPNGRF